MSSLVIWTPVVSSLFFRNVFTPTTSGRSNWRRDVPVRWPETIEKRVLLMSARSRAMPMKPTVTEDFATDGFWVNSGQQCIDWSLD